MSNAGNRILKSIRHARGKATESVAQPAGGTMADSHVITDEAQRVQQSVSEMAALMGATFQLDKQKLADIRRFNDLTRTTAPISDTGVVSIPTTRVHQCSFRLKGTTLQQAFTGTDMGRVFWMNVPTVPEDASDVG